MAESFGDSDTATLRAIARGAGLIGAEQMSHDELVVALREAGLSEPTGKPIDTSLADPGDPGTDAGVYHGAGVGRRETVGGAGAQAAGPTPGRHD
ncbi:MAG TPA: hypothetical protein VFX61_06845 [Micromonosporaceae bacterium]|nr:hypothetical protein [Micromonosporaceae bacterium]